MTSKQKYFLSSFFVGLVLAILFVILYVAFGDMAYVGAAVACGIAGIVGLIGFLVNK